MDKMFPLLVEVLIVIILLRFIPPSQERYHWLKPVIICVSVAKFCVHYGACVSVPSATDDYVTPFIQYITPLVYLPL